MTLLSRISTSLAALALALGALFLVVGCNSDSAEKIFRNVPLLVEGFYVPVEGNTTIVAGNTGAPVTALNLRQSGDQLEAVDNNGLVFRGTIGRAGESEASFTLNGQSTAGGKVTISGNIQVPVGSGNATMRGTWIEPSVFGAVAAVASVPVNNPPSSNTTSALSIAVTGGASIDTSGTDLERTLTASGGDGTYTWTRSSTLLGGLSPTQGRTVTYTALSGTDGGQTITVTDGSGENAVQVLQQGS
jgi:hypothetical protein